MADINEKFQTFLEQVKNLDPENIGSWPFLIKTIIWAIVFTAVLGAGYKLDFEGLHNEKAAAVAKEVELRTEYEKKVEEAANLEAYRAQMAEMEKSFSSLLGQLPTDTEVPGLLDDISGKGLDSGLVFDAIDLKPEKAEEFYTSLPIQLNVRGGYHDFGSFVSGVAGLPRIVTLHDFLITAGAPPSAASKKGEDASVRAGLLSMTITAMTYRYRNPEDGGGPKKNVKPAKPSPVPPKKK